MAHPFNHPSRKLGPMPKNTTTEMPDYKEPNRITMVLQFHHQCLGDKPTSVHSSGHVMLESTEEPNSKRFEVGEEWTPLKFGDLDPDKCGFFTVENLEGKHYIVNPTEAEKLATAERIIEVSMTADSSESNLVLPGWAMPFYPKSAKKVMIRCAKGKASVRTTVFPK